MSDYPKQRIALRYWLLGAGFVKAAEAMTFAERYHTGTRKDGVTPEFAHQVGIAQYVRTQLAYLRHPQETLCVALLHDVREDYDVADAEIRAPFGDVVADGVARMTKTFRGERFDDDALFAAMADDPCASVNKAADRIHNQNSMLGVFTPEKMAAYMEETERLFLPMLKKAKRNFPDQEPVYEASKHVLVSQMNMLHAFLGATKAGA